MFLKKKGVALGKRGMAQEKGMAWHHAKQAGGNTTTDWSCYTKYREAWLTWMLLKFDQVIGAPEAPANYINPQ